MHYRRLRDIGKSQPIATKIKIKSVAQHQTFRGRKHIYKIMLDTYTGPACYILQLCITTSSGRLSGLRVDSLGPLHALHGRMNAIGGAFLLGEVQS